MDIKQWYALIFNLVILLALPIFFIIIRTRSLKNYPKLDLFLLYNSIVLYAQIIFYTSAFCYWGDSFSNPDGGIPWVVVVLTILLTFNVIIGGAGIFMADKSSHKKFVGETQQHHNPIPREGTSEEIRKYLRVIAETGPTLVKGRMINTGQDENVFFWGCEWWNQFEYKSWRNVSITGVEKIEKMMKDAQKSFMIKLHIDIEPDDSETEKQYGDWCPRIGLLKRFLIICYRKIRETPLLEEVLTIPALKDSHNPLTNVRALQFPNILKVGDEGWPFSNNRFVAMNNKSRS